MIDLQINFNTYDSVDYSSCNSENYSEIQTNWK